MQAHNTPFLFFSANPDIIAHVLSFLDPDSLCALACVSRYYYRLLCTPALPSPLALFGKNTTETSVRQQVNRIWCAHYFFRFFNNIVSVSVECTVTC
jgi:hypothetical protein